MRQINSATSLFKFVKAVGKAEEPAFEQQENALQLFMFSRHYDENAINEFTIHGLLPRLTRATLKHYSSLLSTIRQLAFDHSEQAWSKGPAQAMLSFHSDKLLQVRSHALTRKALILQTYVYLRDASAKGFYHESMTESLWTRLAELSSNLTETKPPAGGDGNKRGRCSHCRNPKLHELCHAGPTKSDCPIAEVTDYSKARTIAKKALENWTASPSREGFQHTLDLAIQEMS
jgi:hypothetical protein